MLASAHTVVRIVTKLEVSANQIYILQFNATRESEWILWSM